MKDLDKAFRRSGQWPLTPCKAHQQWCKKMDVRNIFCLAQPDLSHSGWTEVISTFERWVCSWKKICGTQHLQVSRKEWESWGGGAPIGISWFITVLYSYNHDQLSLTSRKPTSLSMMDSTNRMCLQLFARSKLRVAGLPPGMQWQEVKVGGLGFCWDGVVLSKWDQKESAGIFWSLSTLDFGFWDLFFSGNLWSLYTPGIYIYVFAGGAP